MAERIGFRSYCGRDDCQDQMQHEHPEPITDADIERIVVVAERGWEDFTEQERAFIVAASQRWLHYLTALRDARQRIAEVEDDCQRLKDDLATVKHTLLLDEDALRQWERRAREAHNDMMRVVADRDALAATLAAAERERDATRDLMATLDHLYSEPWAVRTMPSLDGKHRQSDVWMHDALAAVKRAYDKARAALARTEKP